MAPAGISINVCNGYLGRRRNYRDIREKICLKRNGRQCSNAKISQVCEEEKTVTDGWKILKLPVEEKVKKKTYIRLFAISAHVSNAHGIGRMCPHKFKFFVITVS